METPWRPRGTVCSPWQGSGGLTLVELVVTMAVLVVLAAGAAQFSPAMFVSVRLTGATNSFLAHLAQVRSEAIKRNASVALCKSRDGEHCAATGGWEQGWIAFHDADNNALRDPGEPVILRSQALAPGIRLSGNGSMAQYVSYSATGATQATNGAFQAGTLTVCQASAQPTEGRQIVISATGRARVRKLALARC